MVQVAHDVAAGLAYLHPSVVHRDLKPHNILLEGRPHAGRAKVCPISHRYSWVQLTLVTANLCLPSLATNAQFSVHHTRSA